jgi:hypothetical protein
VLEQQQSLGAVGRWLVDSVVRERAELGARAAMAADSSVLARKETLVPFIGRAVDR